MAGVDIEDQNRSRDEQTVALLAGEGGLSEELIKKVDKLAESTSSLSFGASGKAMAPRFIKAAKTAVRVASWTFLTGVLIWYLRNKDLLPDAYVSSLNGVVIAIIFNVTTNVATTVQSVFQAFVGTGFAMTVSWLLYNLVPDPTSAADVATVAGPYTCPAGASTAAADTLLGEKSELFDWYCVASTGLVTVDNAMPGMNSIIAFVVYAIFVAVTLSLNVVMPFKTFALVGAVTFFMNYANPAVKTQGEMDLTRIDSMLTVAIVTQLVGSTIAVCAMLLPPVTATTSSKALAARATKVTAEVLLSITQYYCGSSKTLQINVYNSQLERSRADMDGMSTDLNSAWWEFFDWGTAGVVRNLMNDKFKLLKDIQRRMVVMQTCVLREDFGPSHREAMQEMKDPMMKVVKKVNECILTCTLCTADGNFSQEEVSKIEKLGTDIREALVELSSTWRKVRGEVKHALSTQMRAEGFFLLELSTVGRMVADFTEEITVTEKRPRPKPLGWDAIKATISPEKLKKPDFRNFVLRNWISLMLAWWWAVIANGYATSVPMNVVFMLTELPGNSFLMNLQKLQASVLGSLAGTVLYRAFHYCSTITRVAKLSSLFFYELIAMFIANYTKEYANVGLLLAVYGGGKLMMVCDNRTTNGEVLTMNSAEFKALRFFAYAMLIVSVVDSFMKREPACNQARDKLKEAMETHFEYMKKFLNNDVAIGMDKIWEETAGVSEQVEAALAKAEELAPAADQEPRFAKGPFKAQLFNEMVTRTRKMTLNAQVLIRRSQGGRENGKGLVTIMSECDSWRAVKEDLDQTIADTMSVVTQVVSYDGFGAMSPHLFDNVLGKEGMDQVDGMHKLEEEVTNLNFEVTEESEKNLEYGQVSRLAVVFELMELYVKDLAEMMAIAVKHM